MCRRDPKDVSVDGGRMFGVIEHQEVGELLLAELAWHFVDCKKRIWHARESKEAIVPVPHHHIEPEMVACQRQDPAARVPDRRRKRTAQHRPDVVAELFPPCKKQARVWPFFLACNSHPRRSEEHTSELQ